MEIRSEHEVRALVYDAIAEAAEDVPVDALEGRMELEATLGMDSLDEVALVQGLEERLQIQVGNDELEGVRTVDDVVDAVLRALGMASS